MSALCLKVAHSASGLLLCWDFITSSPEPKPNKIADVEVKSLNNFIYVSKNTTFAVSFRIMSNLQ
jgi:hypothetical protein